MSTTNLSSFIWSVAELLRGDYKQSEYGRVILPFTLLRRLECVLEPTRQQVTAVAEKYRGQDDIDPDPFLRRAAGGLRFYNRSGLTLKKIQDDAGHAATNLRLYVSSFSENVREVLEAYEFTRHINRLDVANQLYNVLGVFTDLDLHPDTVPNHNMGYVFEELIRRWSEQ